MKDPFEKLGRPLEDRKEYTLNHDTYWCATEERYINYADRPANTVTIGEIVRRIGETEKKEEKDGV